MNREIKFRVWDGNQFDYDCCLETFTEDKCYTLNEIFVPHEDPEIFSIQQYTGTVDKNGKEIYEGDIIKYHQDGVVGNTKFSSVKFFIAEIAWNDCSFHIVRRKYKFPEGECDTSDQLYSGLCSHIEVIGNIFENKELLK